MDERRLSSPHTIIATVNAVLERELGHVTAQLGAMSPVANELTDPITAFCAGGKRIRALATWWGYELAAGPVSAGPVSAGPVPNEPVPAGENTEVASPIALVAASVELLHAAALIHDDIIDKSLTRRGQPSTHVRFATLHREHGFSGSPTDFGTHAAIIAGDLCLGLSEQLYAQAHFPSTNTGTQRAAGATHNAFRRDVMLGQYLDIRIQAAQVPNAEIVKRAMEVLTYKSAKYSVQQPFELGATLGNATEQFLTALNGFTLPLGQAFQLRDDELGVFGDPAATGKPAGDDLLEGKKTVLVGLALQRLEPGDATWLRDRLDHVEPVTRADLPRMVDLLESSGARAEHAQLIETTLRSAFSALEELAGHGVGPQALSVLRDYANLLTQRSN